MRHLRTSGRGNRKRNLTAAAVFIMLLLIVLSAADPAETEAASSSSGTLVVALDPGHGGTVNGAEANGLVESELNWKIAQYLKAELEEYQNVKVVLTKTKSETVESLQTRVSRATAKNADVLISLHNNAVGTGGAEVWVPNSSSYRKSLHTQGMALGTDILDQLEALGLTRRGVKTKNSSSAKYSDGSTADYYGIIRYARKAGIVGIIVEHAYVDVASDAAFLSSNANLKKLGIADATGIAIYYGLTKVGETQISKASAAASFTSVQLTWSEADNAQGYQIYRRTGSSGSYQLIATVEGGETLSWTDGTVTAGKTYYYKVRAYGEGPDDAVSYGAKSTAQKVYVGPKNVTISSAKTTAKGYVQVKWKRIAASDGYVIYRKTGSGKYSKVAVVEGSDTLSWKDTTVKGGRVYRYKIKAYIQTESGKMVYSTSYSGVKKVQARPGKVTVSSVKSTQSGSAAVKWEKLSNVTGYQIAYKKKGSNEWNYKKVKSAKKTFTDLSGGQYTVKVRAYTTYNGKTYYGSWSSKQTVKVKE